MQLECKFHIWDWDRPGEEYDKPVSQRQPFRAIVKELILKDVLLTGKVADKTLRDTKRLQRCGIYPGDIRPRNYKNRLLIDISTARTEPYYLFNIRPVQQMEKMKNRDLNMWEAMVEESNLQTLLRAVRSEEYCGRLRPRKKKTTGSKR